MQPQSQGSSSPNNLPNITVTSPQLDQQKGYFTYMVSGHDSNGQVEIRRRFNDFFYLRESLRKNWPGLYMPPVPEKMITGNKDGGNIQTRRRYFEYFIQGLSASDNVSNCAIMQEFLRNKGIDMQKFFTSFSYPTPQQAMSLYNTLFGQTLSSYQQFQQPTVEQRKTLSQFMMYLKKAEKELRLMRNSIQEIIDARNNFMTNLHTVTELTLPEYQKRVYSEYLSQNQSKDAMLFSTSPLVQQNVHRLKQTSTNNSFEDTLDMISYQILQVLAMQQLLQDRDNFESQYHKANEKLLTAQSQLTKLMGGKTTLKSFFSKGNKDDQIRNLEKDVPAMREQVENWKRFVNMVTVLIAQREIPRFKKHKQLKYYQVMHTTSQKELSYLAVYGELMKSLMQQIIKVK